MLELSGAWRPSVVVVMPAFQEEGLAEFLDEIRTELASVVSSLRFVVVDDASEPPMAVIAPEIVTDDVRLIRHQVNAGHGRSVLDAYAAGLELTGDLVIHVDGDGQFEGRDLKRLVTALEDADVVHGERRGRDDAWYRVLITRSLCAAMAPALGGRRDVNTPLRGFRRQALASLTPHVPEDSVVPHLHLSRLASRGRWAVVHLDVMSRPRRGVTVVGSSWQGSLLTRWLPSRRLARLCLRAVREVFFAPVVTSVAELELVDRSVDTLSEVA